MSIKSLRLMQIDSLAGYHVVADGQFCADEALNGCSRERSGWYIVLPCIVPTYVRISKVRVG